MFKGFLCGREVSIFYIFDFVRAICILQDVIDVNHSFIGKIAPYPAFEKKKKFRHSCRHEIAS